MSNNGHNNRNHRNNPYVLDGLAVAFHHSAAGIAWRWRTELTLLILIINALYWLSNLIATHWHLTHLTALAWAGAAVALVLAAVVCLPWTRRRFWCLLARHRIQRLCYEARLHTRSGRLPLVLWVRPTKVGERLHLLCRAGICAEDFQAHIGELRAACYAREARVTRNTRWSHLVTIDIIRRDPLAAGNTVPSPLARPRPQPQVPPGEAA